MTAEYSDDELAQQLESIADLPIEQRAEALAAAEKTLRDMLNSVGDDQISTPTPDATPDTPQ
jgi:hypothetical protein